MVDKKVRLEKGELYFLPILSVLEIRCTNCKIFYLFEIDHEKKITHKIKITPQIPIAQDCHTKTVMIKSD